MAEKVKSFRNWREQAGFSQEVLADRLGVTRQTIINWESGVTSPPMSRLVHIAQILSVPLSVLLSDEEAPAQQSSGLMYRADDPSQLNPALRQILTKKATDYVYLEELLHERASLPPSYPLHEYDSVAIEKTAAGIRYWLGVGDVSPISDAIGLLEFKGLKVIRHPLPLKVSGFSAYTESWGGVIVVNLEHPPERQMLTALHELAHLVFHRDEYAGAAPVKAKSDPREKAANHLAGAIMLPTQVVEMELQGYHRKWIPEPLLLDLKNRYWVSLRTVVVRAHQAGIISQEQLGKQLGTIQKKHGVTEPELPALPKLSELGRIERLTFRALAQGLITVSRGAEILSKPLADVRSSLNDWMEREQENEPVASDC
jgi:Zn-dependent peptidase ImmA (M78 family)/transcriptional regulator with XRE-family HTH domain